MEEEEKWTNPYPSTAEHIPPVLDEVKVVERPYKCDWDGCEDYSTGIGFLSIRKDKDGEIKAVELHYCDKHFHISAREWARSFGKSR